MGDSIRLLNQQVLEWGGRRNFMKQRAVGRGEPHTQRAVARHQVSPSHPDVFVEGPA